MAGICVWHLNPCNFPRRYKNPFFTADIQSRRECGIFPMEPPKKKSHEDKRRGRRVRRGAEQLFSLVLIKCGRCSKGQGSTKERKITLKKRNWDVSWLTVCTRRSRSCRLLPSSLSKRGNWGRWERKLVVWLINSISPCSVPPSTPPLFFFQLRDKIPAWQWLPAQLILAKGYDCRAWGLSVWIAAVKMLKGNLFLVYMRAISWSYWD